MNNNTLVERHFARLGVEAVATTGSRTSIDVARSRRREMFVVALPASAEVKMLDTDRRDRHLLLLVDNNGTKSKFLCGHDERHWFVAAIPERARGVTNVREAKLALQPPSVRMSTASLRPKDRMRRRNRAFIRQGEWYFVPEPALNPPRAAVLRHEALSRGRGSAPHWMEFAFRTGGTQVYVSRQYPNGLTQLEFDALPEKARKDNWRAMHRDALVYAMGRITHRDHATVTLPFWHRVLMNTEHQAVAMRHVAFLD